MAQAGIDTSLVTNGYPLRAPGSEFLSVRSSGAIDDSALVGVEPKLQEEKTLRSVRARDKWVTQRHIAKKRS